MDNDRGIGRLPILHCRLELNLLGGFDGIVVEAVTQSVDHAHDMEFAGGLENHFQEDLTLNAQTPSLLSIDGSWLGEDFRGQYLGRGFCGLRVYGGRRGHIGAGEAAGLNRPSRSSASVWGGCAVAKSRTYDYARNTLGAAGSVAISCSGGEIEGSERRDIDRLALICFGRNPIWVAKASGLHLRGSARNRGSSR